MNALPFRTASLIAGFSLAIMAIISPFGLLVALPAGNLHITALTVLIVAALDILVAVALYSVLLQSGAFLASCASAMRIAYAAIFVTSAGHLVGDSDVERFQAIWDMGLFVFGVHLVLVGLALVRGTEFPTWLGILVAIAGAGYLFDAVNVALAQNTSLSLGEFTFVGEIVLLVWLIVKGVRPVSNKNQQTIATEHA
ncbi:DUF4386 domain-containing protein [Timonella sp. A28]|uniref:DUF4386 domain-containing protein n=1 Tax=Timonella sp. A28 TaxID=3442640 RepID=UPI003EBD051A